MAEYIKLEDAVHALKMAFTGRTDAIKSQIDALCRLERVPTADVRPNVKGRWNVEHGVMTYDDIYGDIYRCSECGHWERDVDGHNFCLNCGADMRKQ